MKKEIAILMLALIVLSGCTSTKTEETSNVEQKVIQPGVTVEEAAPGEATATDNNAVSNVETPSTDNTGAVTTEGGETGTPSTDTTSQPIDENAVPGQQPTEPTTTEGATDSTEQPVQN